MKKLLALVLAMLIAVSLLPAALADDVIELNMLILDGMVIGGDVCSTELGGFMHGFDLPAESTSVLTPNP